MYMPTLMIVEVQDHNFPRGLIDVRSSLTGMLLDGGL